MNNIIGITIGDPKGIGPETAAKALLRIPPALRARVRLYGPDGVVAMIGEGRVPATNFDDRAAAEIAKDALDLAIEDAAAGRICALVTCPVNKARMRMVSPGFVGHTEYISQKTGSTEPTMVFIGERRPAAPFIISIVTRHMAISKVGSAITHGAITTTIERTSCAAGRYLGKEKPSVAVFALNPHAGEDGSFGFEEKELIEPAVRKLRGEGIDCSGPFPGDSIIAGKYDAFVAMYHDQGMIPVKLLCGTSCVNATIGLPFVRTSPGHGTAEDIAGNGIANADGLIAAIDLAERLTTTARIAQNASFARSP